MGPKGAILWDQENPNYLELYRYGEPRQTLTRGQGYLSDAAKNATRIPTGHPEGYLEAFATIYVGVVRAIRAHIDGKPLKTGRIRIPHRLRRPSRHAVHHPRDRILQRRLALGGAGLKRDIAGVRSARQTASQLTRCCD